MSAFRLHVLFTGIDFDDDQVFAALSRLDHVDWMEVRGSVIAVAAIEASSATAAAERLVADVTATVPGARPLRLDPELVSVADIAARVGVSREAVRHWAKGSRRDAGFPPPVGSIGAASKPTYVWEWAPVNAWLADNLGLGDEFRYPTALEAAEIDVRLMTWAPAAPTRVHGKEEWKPAELVDAPHLWFDERRIGVMIDAQRELERITKAHPHVRHGPWTVCGGEETMLGVGPEPVGV